MKKVRVSNMTSIGYYFWLAGFLFTVAYCNCTEGFLQTIVMWIAWPYFLGMYIR